MDRQVDLKRDATETMPGVNKENSKTAVTLQDNRHSSISQQKQIDTLHQKSSSHRAIQLKPNTTGLSDQLKSGIENLSGHAMDDVKVHYNSSQPAQLNAHAYAQGNQIHIAPGQEKHLPHEAWHVVQQKQGRVKPTLQMKGKVNINDDEGLEKEADLMGNKALQKMSPSMPNSLQPFSHANHIVQRVQIVDINDEKLDIDDSKAVESFIKQTDNLATLVQLKGLLKRIPLILTKKIGILGRKGAAKKVDDVLPEENEDSRMRREMAAKAAAEAAIFVDSKSFYAKEVDSIPLRFFLVQPACVDFILREANAKFRISGSNLEELREVILGTSKNRVYGITRENLYEILEEWIYTHAKDIMPYHQTPAPAEHESHGPTASQVAPYISEIVHIALGIPVNAYNKFAEEDYDSEQHAAASTGLIREISVSHMALPSLDEVRSDETKLEIVLKNAAKSLMLGRGVCDDFASLAAALMRLVTQDHIHFHHSNAPHNWVTYNAGTKLDAWSYANHGIGGDWGDTYAKREHGPKSVQMALTAQDVQHGITQAFFKYYEAAVELLSRHRDSPAFTARIKTNYFLLKHIIGNRFPSTLTELSNFVSVLRLEASNNLKEEMMAHKHSKGALIGAPTGLSRKSVGRANITMLKELRDETIFQVEAIVNRYLPDLEEDAMLKQALLDDERSIIMQTLAAIHKNPGQGHRFIDLAKNEAKMSGKHFVSEHRSKKEKLKSPTKSKAHESPKPFTVTVKNQYESTNAIIDRKGTSTSRAPLSQQDIGSKTP